METFSALLATCAGNSPVPGEFPTQRPVTQSFNVFSDLCLNKQLNKQSWGWWLETLSRSLWCHCNDDDTPLCEVVWALSTSHKNHNQWGLWIPCKKIYTFPNVQDNDVCHLWFCRQHLQMRFVKFFFFAFSLKFYWSLFLADQLTISLHWFR